jgi:hypothetical protein
VHGRWPAHCCIRLVASVSLGAPCTPASDDNQASSLTPHSLLQVRVMQPSARRASSLSRIVPSGSGRVDGARGGTRRKRKRRKDFGSSRGVQVTTPTSSRGSSGGPDRGRESARSFPTPLRQRCVVATQGCRSRSSSGVSRLQPVARLGGRCRGKASAKSATNRPRRRSRSQAHADRCRRRSRSRVLCWPAWWSEGRRCARQSATTPARRRVLRGRGNRCHR